MSYSIFAAMFADQLEPGQRIRPTHDGEPVTIVRTVRLSTGRVVISHDRGACVRGPKELVQLEVER